MKSLMFLFGLAVTSVVFAGRAILPETVCLMPSGDALAIGERGGCAVTVRDFEGKVLKRFPVELMVDGRLQGAPVTGVGVAPDGTLFWTVEAGNEGRLFREGGVSVITGNRPMSPVVSPDGKFVYVCNRFDATIQKRDAKTLALVAEAKALREAHGCALGKDGKLLFVINMLPDDVTEPVKYTAARVTVVETEPFRVKAHIHLPDGSTGVRGVAASPDGKHIYLTHTQARYQLPTTQLERGWMNTAALSIFDGETGAYINTVLLDDVDLGAANPWGVTVTPDGKSIVVAHAGSREVSVIDRAALHERLSLAAAGQKVTEVSSSAEEVHNDLSFLSGIRRRFPFRADGPRGVAATNDSVFAVCTFADALAEIPFKQRIARPKLHPLNGKALLDLSRDPILRGEMLFNDGSKCFQQWQSCATCHPDGIVDGLNWDLMNDGIGNPKQTKSLYLSGVTPPTMVTGIRKSMHHCNAAGFRHIQFCAVTDVEVSCIDAYVMAMQPQVSPYARPENEAAIARGKAIFEKADCARCHRPELVFTAAFDPNDGAKSPLYDLGLGTRDEVGRKFDVSTLCEVWRTAPYLYDGRAHTIRDVLTLHNPEDLHGVTSDLTEEELSDLEIYVLSL